MNNYFKTFNLILLLKLTIKNNDEYNIEYGIRKNTVL